MFLKYLNYTSGFGDDLAARAVAGKDCQTVLDHVWGTCLPFINPTYVLSSFCDAIIDRRSIRTNVPWTVHPMREVVAHE